MRRQDDWAVSRQRKRPSNRGARATHIESEGDVVEQAKNRSQNFQKSVGSKKEEKMIIIANQLRL